MNAWEYAKGDTSGQTAGDISEDQATCQDLVGDPGRTTACRDAAAEQFNSVGPIKDQFAPAGWKTPQGVPDQAGLHGAGLKEAVALQWTLGGSKDSFSYAIDGAPGALYAVDISAINWKDKELPVFASPDPFAQGQSKLIPTSKEIDLYASEISSSGVVGIGGTTHSSLVALAQLYFTDKYLVNPQYLRVFTPNAPTHNTCTPSCTCPGQTCDTGNPTPPSSNPPPTPTVTLAADTPLQARQASTQSVTIAPVGVLTDQQAIVPESTFLELMSPNPAVNGVDTPACDITGTNLGLAGDAPNSYCPNYVQSESDLGFRSSLNDTHRLGYSPPTATQAQLGAQADFLHQIPALSDLSRNVYALAENNFGITWLDRAHCRTPARAHRTISVSTLVGTLSPGRLMPRCAAAPPPTLRPRPRLMKGR